MKRSRYRILVILSIFVVVAFLVPALGNTGGSSWSARAQLLASTITLEVQDTSGDPISSFKFIVNENNVGERTGDPSLCDPDTNPSYPVGCDWPSIKPDASHSPMVAVGDSTSPAVTLEDGKYLISVLAPGHKLGGKHLTLPDDAGTVVVQLVPHPLPLSTIRIHVFHDDSPVNGEDDVPLESGIEGFSIIIEDTVGEVTVDYFGNPLGTQYQKDAGTGELIFDAEGNPILIPGTGGRILTDADGDAIIENLPPGKYEVQAIPPDGSGWIQTTTIEGTHVIDAWIEEGNSGYSPREGFQAALVWIGFVKEMDFATPGTGTITGLVRTTVEWTPPVSPLVLGDPVDRPYIALTDIGATDEQVYLGRGNPDGSFAISDVPASTYQMAIWDEPLDYIITFRTVIVGEGQPVDMGDFGIPRWFGWVQGSVFYDENEDTIRDPGESGIPGEELDTRFRDGSIQYVTASNVDGSYVFPEVFELERFAVAEVGFGRFAQVGASVRSEYDPDVVKSTHEGALTLAELTWAAKKNYIDWGKHAYNPGENGGISGIVYYATTRNELDPRYAAPEDYEPGIPGVTLNLYSVQTDPVTGQPLTDPATGAVLTDELIATTVTDSWEHPSGCDVLDSQGNPLLDPLELGPNCIEVPNISVEVKDGVFDGGYAFEGIPPGMYVVEVIPPDGYIVVAEEHVNTDQGDEFLRLVPPSPPEPFTLGSVRGPWTAPPLAGELHTVDDPRSPYDGQDRPLGNRKLVTLRDGLNAAADFFLFTDVPVPGRIVGFLLDDVNVETDPERIYYGEKRGIPNAPVGIRDFTGRLITTVHSDANGIFEVLLPSTYTANVPTPSGVAPGMYRVVGNDPGDPDNPNPNYDPNYQTLTFVFDVWPGKTTYADVALFPITAFVEFPGAQFSQPPQCLLAPDTPQLWTVSQPYAPAGGSFTIHGAGFGLTQGTVMLDEEPLQVTSWSQHTIVVTVPGSRTPGPGQLAVTASNGKASPTGLTFHVLGGAGENEYQPNILTVKKDGTGDFTSIQAAISAAPSNEDTLIVVYPGIYAENIIFYRGLKLQGVGPGAPNGIGGAVIDGKYFAFNAAAWETLLGSISFDGNQEIPNGAAITVVAGQYDFKAQFTPSIDGFYITGARGEEGGAFYVNAHARYLQTANNVIQGNGGGFGGALTIGRPYVGDNHNDSIRIHHNRILNNGGISLAGAIGIFNGADNYEIAYNDICGNYSAEYGGGISHFGLSPDGEIHHNKVIFNYSFDEGGGILVGGEQLTPIVGLGPAGKFERNGVTFFRSFDEAREMVVGGDQPVLKPTNERAMRTTVAAGSGSTDIYNNLVQGNVSNDDGGGIRLLQPTTDRINIVNNMVVNNVATDFGGGIALDDASNVAIVNNTIAHNISTATAEDSDGNPHSAGLLSENHTAPFMATLPPGSSDFSDPILFNNIFWNNVAYTWDGTQLVASGPIDLEVFGTLTLEYLSPNYSVLTVPYGPSNPTNVVGGDPLFVVPYGTELDAVAFRMEPDFITVIIVTVTVPEPGVIPGDYHIQTGSSAIDVGASDFGGVAAPIVDFDGDARPEGDEYDIGADEYVPVP